MGEIARGSLTPEQVVAYTDALTRHYGERVAPVGEYCRAFREWQQAWGEKCAREGMDITKPQEFGLGRSEGDTYYLRALRAMQVLELPIFKSDLLARLVYGGERLRTEMCPVHKGVWQGIPWPPPECGCDLKGWLPSKPKTSISSDRVSER